MSRRTVSQSRRQVDLFWALCALVDPFGDSTRSQELLTLHYTVVRQLVNVTPIEEVHRIDGMMTFAKHQVAEEFPDKGKRLRPGMAGASKLRKQIEMMLQGTRDEVGKKTDLYEAYDRVLQDIRSKPLWHQEGVGISNPT